MFPVVFCPEVPRPAGPALPQGGRKTRSKGFSACPVCGLKTKTARKHVVSTHLPRILWDGETEAQLMDPQFQRVRLDCLEHLARMVCGPTARLWDVCHLLESRDMLANVSEISASAGRAMASLCLSHGWSLPAQFTLHPINSMAVLLHWRPLAALLGLLPEGGRNTFLEFCQGREQTTLGPQPTRTATVTAPVEGVSQGYLVMCRDTSDSVPFISEDPLDMSEAVGAEGREAVIVQDPVVGSLQGADLASAPTFDREEGILEAYDSHFHLDRTVSQLLRGRSVQSLSGDEQFNRLMEFKSPVQPSVSVRLVGMVAVYCDPETYPAELPTDPRLRFAVGIHPRKAESFSEEHLCALRRILTLPGVTALGEVGLDWTEPRDTWPKQEEVLRNVLRYSCSGQVLVLHLRDRKDNVFEVYKRGRQIVREFCGPSQPMHLHCFGGDRESVMSWSMSFPNCYFGFTGRVSCFSEERIQGLKAVPLDRLLLETDSPYLPPFSKKGVKRGKASVNTPRFIGDVAKLVAPLRGITLENLCRQTTENGQKLYSGSPN